MKGGRGYSSLVDLGGIRENLASRYRTILLEACIALLVMQCVGFSDVGHAHVLAFDLSARDVLMCRATELLEMTVFW